MQMKQSEALAYYNKAPILLRHSYGGKPMKRVVFSLSAAAIFVVMLPSIALPQSITPILAVPVERAGTVLPRNTPVYLTLNETLNTKSSATKRGNTFTMTVEQNVLLNRYIVIPRGSRAVGTITKRTGKGGFGKSGKLDVSLDYIEVGDNRIPILGSHREEGEGNSTATIATFMFVSMLGSGLITGHSAEIPSGQRFTAWTKEDVPVVMADALGEQPAVTSMPTLPGTLIAQALPDRAAAARKAAAAVAAEPRFGNSRVRCDTCR